MPESAYQVELTTNFLETLESVGSFLAEADALYAYDDLLAALKNSLIPNLRRFPRMGRRYLDQPPQSAEAIAQLGLLPNGTADELRILGHDEYLILYAYENKHATVYLLSIRHHRQLSFDFSKLWPAAGQKEK